MSDEIELVALGTIVLGTGQMELTGETHADGSPISRATSREVRPGQRFRVNQEFARTLMEGPRPFAALPGSEAAEHAIARMNAADGDYARR